MNDKEVLIRIIDAKNDYPIRTDRTSIPSEVHKMYDYMANTEWIYLSIEKPLDEGYSSVYDDTEAEVTDVSVTPGGHGFLFTINVYVKVI